MLKVGCFVLRGFVHIVIEMRGLCPDGVWCEGVMSEGRYARSGYVQLPGYHNNRQRLTVN